MKASLSDVMIKAETVSATVSGCLAVYLFAKEPSSILYIFATSVIGLLLSLYFRKVSIIDFCKLAVMCVGASIFSGMLCWKHAPHFACWLSFLISFLLNTGLNIRYSNSEKYSEPVLNPSDVLPRLH